MLASPDAANVWLDGYKAGRADAERGQTLERAGDFLRFDELAPNPYEAAKPCECESCGGVGSIHQAEPCGGCCACLSWCTRG